MRNNYDSNASATKVNEIINELGLDHCRNVYCGGKFMKGLSGGERKRTSIGTELVNDP